MSATDIDQVVEIERESFPSIWPQTAYRRELTNQIARYVVITELDGVATASAPPLSLLQTIRRMGRPERHSQTERLLGFIGVWLMVGEAHVVTVAVRETYRRMGIGERLLIAAVEMAMELEQELVTLEVRASNIAAQTLYEKYGFLHAGLRRRYYTDNNEDAAIMTTPELTGASFRDLFERLREQHRARHPDLWA